jgi:hypothetical protein
MGMKMPRQKVEIIVEFECGIEDDIDACLSAVCEAVESVLPEATNCFSDIVGVDEL